MNRLVLTFAMLVSTAASAHPLGMGQLRLSSEGDQVRIELELDAGGLDHVLDIDESELARVNWQTASRELADKTYRLAALSTPQGDCTWGRASAVRTGKTVRVSETVTCPSGAERLDMPVPFVTTEAVAASFLLLVKANVGGKESVATLDRRTPVVSVAWPRVKRRGWLRPGLAGAGVGGLLLLAFGVSWRRWRR